MKNKLNYSLRLSIIDKCTFACKYCPNSTNMENFCPEKIRENKLNVEEFKEILTKILDKYEFTKIVITGGEPLLSNNLVEILRLLKQYNNKIELDTNGSLFSYEIWEQIKNYIDGVKVSLDSLNPEVFDNLTNNKNPNTLSNIKNLMDVAISDNIPVTINCVYTKFNKNDVLDVIKFAIEKNINISILDLYYTIETRDFWKKNFIDIAILEKELESIYGNIKTDDAYGCQFKYIFYNEKNYIKFKSSNSSTMRDKKCEECENYCQEGMFSLRLSCQGWATTCQLNESNGFLLTNNISRLEELIDRLNNASLDSTSFENMLKIHKLER